jgi:predicted solute-binding protein
MTQDEINVIESNAGKFLSAFINSSEYSSKHQNEYIEESIDYALELHNQLNNRIKLLEQQEMKNNPNIPQSCPPESPPNIRW